MNAKPIRSLIGLGVALLTMQESGLTREQSQRSKIDFDHTRKMVQARDGMLKTVDWRFEVYRSDEPGKETHVVTGRLVRDGFRSRLEKTEHQEERSEISTWDGTVFTRTIRDWKHPERSVRSVGSDPGSTFHGGVYPEAFGLTLGAALPLSHVFGPDFTLEARGEREISGDRCTELIVLPAQGSAGRPMARIWFDHRRTLLAKRIETLDRASAEDRREDVVTVKGVGYAPQVTWTVVRSRELDGVWIPVEGLEEFPAFEGVPTLRTVVDEDALSLGGPVAPEIFSQDTEAGKHVRDLETGRLRLHGTNNHESVVRGYVDRLIAQVCERDGLDRPAQLAPTSEQWCEASCGVIATYMYLSVLGENVDLCELATELAEDDRGELSMRQLLESCRERGIDVRAYEVSWGQLSRLRGNFVLHFESPDGVHRHFLLAASEGSRLRVVDVPDSLRLLDEEQFRERFGQTVRVLAGGDSIRQRSALLSGGVASCVLVVALVVGGFLLVRRAVVVLLLLAFVLVPTGCGQGPEPSGRKILSAVSETVFDAGSVPHGSIVTHTFVVRNVTDETVVIDEIQKSCGCASAVVRPQTLAAGESAEVEVKVEMDTRYGREAEVRLISSRHPGRPLLGLRVRASVNGTERLLVEPRHIQVGDLRPGEETEAMARVRYIYRTGDPLPGLEVDLVDSWLASRVIPGPLSPAATGLNTQEFELALAVLGPSTPGAHETVVRIGGGRESVGTTDLTVHLRVVGPVVAEPGRVFLGAVREEGRWREIRLRTRDESVTIERLECTDDRVRFDWMIAGDDVLVKVWIEPGRPSSYEGQLDCSLRVFVEGDRKPVLSIPVIGTIRG